MLSETARPMTTRRLATVVFTLGIASTLFWSDALPILPRAHAEADA